MARSVAFIRINAVHTVACSLDQRVIFPSFMAPTRPEFTQAMPPASEADVVTVDVNGLYFTAGRDSLQFQSPQAHAAWRHFTLSQIGHLALIRTGLWYLQKPQIDLLIVGLPLSALARHQKPLNRRLPGVHILPASRQPGPDTDKVRVDIHEVLVMPQSVAALFAASNEHPSVHSSDAVVLDLGLQTLDILCAANLRPVAGQQGSVRGGILGYINHIAGSLVQNGPQESAAEASINNGPARWTDAFPSLVQPIRKGSALLNDYLDQAITQVPAAREMRTAVLTGSGARLLAPLLAERLPRITQIIIPRTPEHTLLQHLAQSS